ncbi:hypothetical protein NL676_038401 [Syzygium grande]|nr:hypothetical protein NL676_038401 [Syzygium grande]
MGSRLADARLHWVSSVGGPSSVTLAYLCLLNNGQGDAGAGVSALSNKARSRGHGIEAKVGPDVGDRQADGNTGGGVASDSI